MASEIARYLRKNPTEAERLLWGYLRGKKLKGLRFRRQQPLGGFVVDFVCFSRKLIIELDGSPHLLQKEEDRSRTRYLNFMGYKVIRFWNQEVVKEICTVIEKIKSEMGEPPPASP